MKNKKALLCLLVILVAGIIGGLKLWQVKKVDTQTQLSEVTQTQEPDNELVRAEIISEELPESSKQEFDLDEKYENWVNPVSLYYDPACLQKSSDCEDLGQAQIRLGDLDQYGRAKIFAISDDPENVEIGFYSGTKQLYPRFKTESYLTSNHEWFGLNIWGGNDLFIGTFGGHEGYPEYYMLNRDQLNPTWEKFDPWEYLKADFPDTRQPPFSLGVGPQFIRLEEVKYCCDTVYNSEDQFRSSYRMVYVLRKEYDQNGKSTYKISKKYTVPRN